MSATKITRCQAEHVEAVEAFFKPILFSTPMVQAILEGRKTMTRRVLKVKGCKPFIPDNSWDFDTVKRWNKNYYPYGKPGDILWVRETWNCISYLNPDNTEYKYFYKADNGNEFSKWKPSIFMPKEACRLFLKITDVRVERLNDISEEDAKAEGILELDIYNFPIFKNYMEGAPSDGYQYPPNSFKSLWESIHGSESWNVNPWVWVISFERILNPKL